MQTEHHRSTATVGIEAGKLGMQGLIFGAGYQVKYLGVQAHMAQTPASFYSAMAQLSMSGMNSPAAETISATK